MSLVTLAEEMIVESEARACESKSHHFKRACAGNHNSAILMILVKVTFGF